ncbi:MAG TPA: c-type cytochrome [Gaiellaceae bacterium]|nr:c-type cytochrome [Gaiellaceae bacterium]
MSTEEQREQYSLYKEDVQKRGKSFFPYAMFHDTVMSLVVVCVIIALAVIWYGTAGEGPSESGLLGPLYTEKADPGTTEFVPRPDWYFFFLFYLLRIFEWPESVVLGTVGIPTILLILLFALPFIDRRRDRRIGHRPVAVVAGLLVIASMGVLTYKGATAEEPSEVGGPALCEANGLPCEEEQRVALGSELFAEVGCLNCHVYAGYGAPALGAPELTDIGTVGRGEEYWVDWIKNPQAIKPGTQMPAFPNLTQEELEALAAFLEASKGDQGGG